MPAAVARARARARLTSGDVPEPEVRRNASSPDNSNCASGERLTRSTSICTLRQPWHSQATGASHVESKNGSMAISHCAQYRVVTAR